MNLKIMSLLAAELVSAWVFRSMYQLPIPTLTSYTKGSKLWQQLFTVCKAPLFGSQNNLKKKKAKVILFKSNYC